MKKDAIILAYGGGGHNEQMIRLNYQLDDLIPDSLKPTMISVCNVDVRKPITKEVYFISTPLFKKSFKEIYKLPISIIKAVLTAIRINHKYKVKLVISTGPLIGVIISLSSKLMGVRIIYIETWSRFYSKSLSGKLAYLFSDYLYIQNESLKSVYPKAIYKSRL